MIYLDSAATSLQKPRSVGTAMLNAMNTMSSPGRGGHRFAMLAADTAFECRSEIAELFNVDGPEKIVFTLNATHALNIAINTLVKSGDKVVVSGYEHNSVTRPLAMIGANVHVASSPLFDEAAAVEAFRAALPGAKAAVCCHVSNVFGFILPVKAIARACAEYSVPLVIDASQSAGTIDIDFKDLGAEFVAMPGHKGLMGPQGTGVLICAGSADPLLAGGTGSDSALSEMPGFLPDRLEAGTHNIPGIAGLLEGVRYVRRTTPKAILGKERRLMSQLISCISGISGIGFFYSEKPGIHSGVLSVVTRDVSCDVVAAELGARGIAVRSGLHCAPTAHRTAGTLDTGTLRFSFSPFNVRGEVIKAAAVFSEIAAKYSPQ